MISQQVDIMQCCPYTHRSLEYNGGSPKVGVAVSIV